MPSSRSPTGQRPVARRPARAARRLLGLVTLLGAGCQHAAPAPQLATTPPFVVFRPQGGEVRIAVELATTEPERARGLMHRTSLAPGSGMLFLFPREEPLKFWMRNTLIPLDMVFMDGQRQVLFIEESAAPLTETPRGPDVPSKYVLEVPGGYSRSHGIVKGLVAEFVHLPVPPTDR